MLKLILLTLMLTLSSTNWKIILNSLLFMSFLTASSCNHDFFLFNLSLNFGLDHTSFTMILLSMWISSLMILSSQKILETKNFPKEFLMTSIILLLALVLTFSSTDYLLFYIFFESSLIPTLILILGWGYQPERIQAGIYMLFYTLTASLPLLASLLNLYSMGGTLTLGLSMKILSSDFVSSFWFFASIMAFIVKLPMFFFHLWLPKAHVEAPVAGSMILAAVLLKLGGYGLIRMLPLFPKLNSTFAWVWMSASILGGIIVSLMCLRQVDIKSLIAYSSVAHMSLVLCGLTTSSSWGLNGSVIIMIGHGLCSSGLFCLANMVYERMGTRSLLISKGLLGFMPSMSLWWFLLSISNMAAPPTLNLLGEICLIISVLSWSKMTMISIASLSFLSASYTLYMFSLSQHGLFFNSLFSCCSGKTQEFTILFLHWFPLNILILKGAFSLQ